MGKSEWIFQKYKMKFMTIFLFQLTCKPNNPCQQMNNTGEKSTDDKEEV